MDDGGGGGGGGGTFALLLHAEREVSRGSVVYCILAYLGIILIVHFTPLRISDSKSRACDNAIARGYFVANKSGILQSSRLILSSMP